MEKIKKEEDDCYFRSNPSERNTGRFEEDWSRFEEDWGRKKEEEWR